MLNFYTYRFFYDLNMLIAEYSVKGYMWSVVG